MTHIYTLYASPSLAKTRIQILSGINYSVVHSVV